MERIRDEWNRGMSWRQPRPFVPEFELRRGGHRFAELDFWWNWTLQARARAYDRTWKIERKNMWTRSVTMIDERTGHPALKIRLPRWRRATLYAPSGHRYTAHPAWIGTQYRILDEDGSPAITYTRKLRVLTFEADVEIDPKVIDRLELPDLVVAGWYLATVSSWHSIGATPAMPSRSLTD